jgi:UDP-N-acetyl-D-galactosamine dehydrogenase
MTTIAIIGLGYVGLPLVAAFGRIFKTLGYDNNVSKVESCSAGVDPSGELSEQEMRAAEYAEYTADPARLAEADVIIIAVPTPVNIAHQPDFGPLISASKSAGEHMKPGAIVIYESTVYPGATEEVCIPVLERFSGMKWKEGFHVGYSPERINPGDREHTLTRVVKVVSGDSPETLDKVAGLYERIVVPGVYRTSSIKAAEASKVIENTQRDLNIALMNELALIFNKFDIDTTEVIEAAGTKWNFLKFRPGLVGGHCIGVDPYYLTHKAEMIGYNPQVILAGRRINDGMGKFIAEQTVKRMIESGSYVKGTKVIVLGLTFKENCGDIRNTKVVDILNEFKDYGIEAYVHDPEADAEQAKEEYGVELVAWDKLPRADAIVAAVAHRKFLDYDMDEIGRKLVRGGCFMDVKAAFDAEAIQSAGFRVWRL